MYSGFNLENSLPYKTPNRDYYDFEKKKTAAFTPKDTIAFIQDDTYDKDNEKKKELKKKKRTMLEAGKKNLVIEKISNRFGWNPKFVSKLLYFIVFIQEAFLLIMLYIILGQINVETCIDNLKDWSLKANVYPNDYLNYWKCDRMVCDGAETITDYQKTSSNMVMGMLMNPVYNSVKNVTNPIYEHWNDNLVKNQIIFDHKFIESIFEKFSTYLDISNKLVGYWNDKKIIIDDFNHPLSYFVQPLTSEVQYFTSEVSYLIYKSTYHTGVPIDSTNRTYPDKSIEKKDTWIHDNQTHTYSYIDQFSEGRSTAGGYYKYFNPWETINPLYSTQPNPWETKKEDDVAYETFTLQYIMTNLHYVFDSFTNNIKSSLAVSIRYNPITKLLSFQRYAVTQNENSIQSTENKSVCVFSNWNSDALLFYITNYVFQAFVIIDITVLVVYFFVLYFIAFDNHKKGCYSSLCHCLRVQIHAIRNIVLCRCPKKTTITKNNDQVLFKNFTRFKQRFNSHTNSIQFGNFKHEKDELINTFKRKGLKDEAIEDIIGVKKSQWKIDTFKKQGSMLPSTDSTRSKTAAIPTKGRSLHDLSEYFLNQYSENPNNNLPAFSEFYEREKSEYSIPQHYKKPEYVDRISRQNYESDAMSLEKSDKHECVSKLSYGRKSFCQDDCEHDLNHHQKKKDRSELKFTYENLEGIDIDIGNDPEDFLYNYANNKIIDEEFLDAYKHGEIELKQSDFWFDKSCEKQRQHDIISEVKNKNMEMLTKENRLVKEIDVVKELKEKEKRIVHLLGSMPKRNPLKIGYNKISEKSIKRQDFNLQSLKKIQNQTFSISKFKEEVEARDPELRSSILKQTKLPAEIREEIDRLQNINSEGTTPKNNDDIGLELPRFKKIATWKETVNRIQNYRAYVDYEIRKQRFNLFFSQLRQHFFNFENIVLVVRTVMLISIMKNNNSIFNLYALFAREVEDGSTCNWTMNYMKNCDNQYNYDITQRLYQIQILSESSRFLFGYLFVMSCIIVIYLLKDIQNSVRQLCSILTDFFNVVFKFWKIYMVIVILFLGIMMYLTPFMANTDTDNKTLYKKAFVMSIALLNMQFTEQSEFMGKNDDNYYTHISSILACLVIAFVQIVLNGIFRANIVVYLSKGRANRKIRTYERMSDKLYHKGRSIYNFFYITFRSLNRCCLYCFAHKRYETNLYSDKLEAYLDQDAKKIPSNLKYEIDITDKEFCNYLNGFKSYKSRIERNKKRTVKLFGVLFIFVSYNIILYLLSHPSRHYSVTKLIDDNFTKSQTDSKTKIYNEYELRRYLVDVFGQFIAEKSYKREFKHRDFLYPDIFSNVSIANIISDFAFDATYKAILPNPDEEFRGLNPWIYDREGPNIYPPGDIIKNQNFTIVKSTDNELDEIFNITSANLTYKWDTETKTLHANIFNDKNQTNFMYVLSKQILDNYINKYLYSLDIYFFGHNEEKDDYTWVTFSFERGYGDNFEIFQQIEFLDFKNDLIYDGILVFVILLQIYYLIQLFKNRTKFFKMRNIYYLWYRIQIKGKFNDFMRRYRKKKVQECVRMLTSVGKIRKIFRTILVSVINLCFIASIIALKHTQSTGKTILHHHKSELVYGIELTLNFKIILRNYVTYTKFSMICIVQNTFSSIWTLQTYTHAYMRQKIMIISIQFTMYITFLVAFPILMIASIFIDILHHAMDGETNNEFPVEHSWLSILQCIISPSPTSLFNKNKLEGITIIKYTFIMVFMILPLRYMFISVVIAKIQMTLEENNHKYDTKQVSMGMGQKKSATALSLIAENAFGQYLYSKYFDKNAAKGQKIHILDWIEKTVNLLPDRHKLGTLDRFITKQSLNLTSRYSENETIALVVHLEKQFKRLNHHKELVNQICIRFIMLSRNSIKVSKHNAVRKTKKADEQKIKLFKNFLDNIVDNAVNINVDLSEQRAKGEVIHRERVNNSYDYNKTKTKIKNVKLLELQKYKLVKIYNLQKRGYDAVLEYKSKNMHLVDHNRFQQIKGEVKIRNCLESFYLKKLNEHK